MLEEEYLSTIDTILSFLTTLLDRVSGNIANPVLTRLHATYSYIVNHLLYGRTWLGDSSASKLSLIHKLELLTRTEKEILGTIDNMSLVALEFQIVNQNAESFQTLGAVWYLDAGPFRVVQLRHKFKPEEYIFEKS